MLITRNCPPLWVPNLLLHWILLPQALEGYLLALEPCTLLVIDGQDYENIIENGFDGTLKRKIALLKEVSKGLRFGAQGL